jgi:hypothetical protein
LTSGEPQYLQAHLTGGYGDSSVLSPDPLWWPPTKIVGRYLAPTLARFSSQYLSQWGAVDEGRVASASSLE